MTITAFTSVLQSFNPDHLPSIRQGVSDTLCTDRFTIDDYSIIKFVSEHYSGNWEVYNPGKFDDVYRSPTLVGIIEFILTFDPGFLYSPTAHPELFI